MNDAHPAYRRGAASRSEGAAACTRRSASWSLHSYEAANAAVATHPSHSGIGELMPYATAGGAMPGSRIRYQAPPRELADADLLASALPNIVAVNVASAIGG